MPAISETIRQLRFWYGLLFGTTDGERLWSAISVDTENISQGAFGVYEEGLLLVPPVLTKQTASTVRIGAWKGFSRRLPMFQLGNVDVSVAQATYGSLQGSTLAPTVGKHRNVAIIAVHRSVEVGPVVDALANADYSELHHGIKYDVIMTPEYEVGVDAVPAFPDLAAALAAGYIILANLLVGDTTVDLSNLTPNLYNLRISGGSIPRHLYWLQRVVRPGALVKASEGEEASSDPPSIVSSFLTPNITLSINTVTPWACILKNRLFSLADLVNGLSVVAAVVANTDYFVYLSIDTAGGRWYPLLSVGSVQASETLNKILIATFSTNGSGVPGSITNQIPGVFTNARANGFVSALDSRLTPHAQVLVVQGYSTTIGAMPLNVPNKGLVFGLKDFGSYNRVGFKVALKYTGAGADITATLYNLTDTQATNAEVTLSFSGNDTLFDEIMDLGVLGSGQIQHENTLYTLKLTASGGGGSDAVEILGAWIIIK